MRPGVNLDRLIHYHLYHKKLDITPGYSTDWAATGKLLGFFTKLDDMVHVDILIEEDFTYEGDPFKVWVCEIIFERPGMNYKFIGKAETPQMAICIASLEYFQV